MSRAKLSSSLLARRAAFTGVGSTADLRETRIGEGAGGSGQSNFSIPVGTLKPQTGVVRSWGLACCGLAALLAAGALFMHSSERGAARMALLAESSTPDTTPFVAAGIREPVTISEAAVTPRQQTVTDPAAVPIAQVSSDQVATLLVSGEAALRIGDIATARLYFARATEAENSRAALRLGNTYDPAFLSAAGLKGIHSDAVAAERWYRYAQALGSVEARTALVGLAHNDNISNTSDDMSTLFERFLSRTGGKPR